MIDRAELVASPPSGRFISADAGLRLVLDLGLGGALPDQVERLLAVGFRLVPLAGGGDDLAVGRLEPPAVFLRLVLVHLELVGGLPALAHLLLNPLDPPLAIVLGFVAL